jgi:hypothetical protein
VRPESVRAEAAVEFVHLSGVGSRSRKARSWAD